jgi:hypothetical protein
MQIDICDQDDLWSSAKIVNVKEALSPPHGHHLVTVRYHGWGHEWDETIPFENNQRLAKYGTHTKQYKCMVDLLPKSKKKKNSKKTGGNKNPIALHSSPSSSSMRNNTLWPCIVNIRTPNSFISVEKYKKAEEFLSMEPKIFVQPYGLKEKYLHQNHLVVSSTMVMGGLWRNTSKIRAWNSVSSPSSSVDNSFDLALKLALNDSIMDILPGAYFEKGSLVKAKYRILPEDYDNSTSDDNLSDDDNDLHHGDTASSTTTATMTPTATAIENELIYYPPAQLPLPIEVNQSIFPREYQIVLSTKTGKWIASINKNGNDFILGSFRSQIEAKNAIDDARVKKRISNREGDKIMMGHESVKHEDMTKLSLETILSLVHCQRGEILNGDGKAKSSSQGNANDIFGSNQFSLHEWTVQNTKHKAYKLEKFREFQQQKRERELQEELALKDCEKRAKNTN